MTIERRALTAPLEVRAESRTIAGYAAVFNSETDIGGMFREQIAPGAFKASLSGDVRALFDHDTAHVLGRTKAGTLRLSEDERGLAVEIDLPDTQTGRDLRESMNRGDIDGMSFGFRVTKQEWDESGETPLRTIREVELFEVSVVTFPAYADTEVALRSLNDERGERERKEQNAARAKARIAARKAEQEQKFRGIK
jgi:HK97 family phage prohead protease